MYNRYTCPLQPCTHLNLKLLIQGYPRSAEVTNIADFKSAYNSLIIGPRPLVQGQTRIAKRKSAYNSLIIKRPLRDACLCMGDLQAPPAPHFVFLITL